MLWALPFPSGLGAATGGSDDRVHGFAAVRTPDAASGVGMAAVASPASGRHGMDAVLLSTGTDAATAGARMIGEEDDMLDVGA